MLELAGRKKKKKELAGRREEWKPDCQKKKTGMLSTKHLWVCVCVCVGMFLTVIKLCSSALSLLQICEVWTL